MIAFVHGMAVDMTFARCANVYANICLRYGVGCGMMNRK